MPLNFPSLLPAPYVGAVASLAHSPYPESPTRLLTYQLWPPCFVAPLLPLSTCLRWWGVQAADRSLAVSERALQSVPLTLATLRAVDRDLRAAGITVNPLSEYSIEVRKKGRAASWPGNAKGSREIDESWLFGALTMHLLTQSAE